MMESTSCRRVIKVEAKASSLQASFKVEEVERTNTEMITGPVVSVEEQRHLGQCWCELTIQR